MTREREEFDHAAALEACARGDQQALHAIYLHEGGRLLGVVQRIVRDRSMAEDIVHDACLNIWRRASTYDRSRGSARAWIFSVARHLALNAIRDRRREVVTDDPHQVEPLESAGPQDVADWQVGARMDHCLAQLEPERRACLLHAYVNGYSHAEIATHTDTPLGTVKAWIRRSLERLRECMS